METQNNFSGEKKMENATVTEREVREVTVDQLVNELFDRKGCAFMAFDADYPLDSKMNKRGNPFYGIGLRKLATTSLMVTFDYEKSMETRTGEAHESKGSWHIALTRRDGSLTPFAVHKADVHPDGSPILGARLYLRGELRKSESRFVDKNGNAVDKVTVEPWLKKHGETGPVDFHLISLNNLRAVRIDGVEYRIIQTADITGHGQVTANV